MKIGRSYQLKSQPTAQQADSFARSAGLSRPVYKPALGETNRRTGTE
jgi:hypothetical protein